ncbi:MAG: cytochrome b [Caulobacteraceae bacterium]
MAERRYNAVAMLLHWLIAGLLLWNIGLSWYFDKLEGMAKIAPIQLHKSIGLTILVLSLARLGWRFISPPPALPGYVRGWERFAAHATYVLFYVIMIGMPLTGWAFSSASRLIHLYPLSLFGVIPWPAIAPLANLPTDQMKAAHDAFELGHEVLGKLAYLLILLHVGAALRHQFFKRDDIVARMVPLLRMRHSA